MDCAAVGSVRTGEFVESMHGQAVEPGLKSQALRFFFIRAIGAVAERGGDGFVDYFVFGDGVGRNEVGGFAEIDFAFYEALEAGEVYVDVGAHVLGGNRCRKHDGQRLLEGYGKIAPGRALILTTGPLVR